MTNGNQDCLARGGCSKSRPQLSPEEIQSLTQAIGELLRRPDRRLTIPSHQMISPETGDLEAEALLTSLILHPDRLCPTDPSGAHFSISGRSFFFTEVPDCRPRVDHNTPKNRLLVLVANLLRNWLGATQCPSHSPFSPTRGTCSGFGSSSCPRSLQSAATGCPDDKGLQRLLNLVKMAQSVPFLKGIPQATGNDLFSHDVQSDPASRVLAKTALKVHRRG